MIKEIDKKMEELIEKVEAWSKERGLDAADTNKQRLKLWEEFGELNASIARNNRDDAIDAIGDMLVVMTIYCQQIGYPKTKGLFEVDVVLLEYYDRMSIIEILDQIAVGILGTKTTIKGVQEIITILANMAERLDTTLEECLQAAYDEIKDRRGKMVNGVFVKESDLNS